jgi:tetratricopeptide (TPR) repeat protein
MKKGEIRMQLSCFDAYILSLKGKHKEAKKLFKACLKKSLDEKNFKEIKDCYLYLHQYYLNKGEIKKARETIEEGEAIIFQNDQYKFHYLDFLLGHIILLVVQFNDYDTALMKCNNILKKLKRRKSFLGLKVSLKSLQLICYLNKGKWLQALKILKQLENEKYKKRIENFLTKINEEYINIENLDKNNKYLTYILETIEKLSKGTEFEDRIKSFLVKIKGNKCE